MTCNNMMLAVLVLLYQSCYARTITTIDKVIPLSSNNIVWILLTI